MQIKCERINSANAKVEATLIKSDIDSKIDAIAKDLSKSVKIDGFRKGKVPLTVVKNRYQDKITKDAEGELLREVYENSLKELEIVTSNIIGEPKVLKYEQNGDNIDVEIKYCTRPTIVVENYIELVPAVSEISVSDSEIDERLNSLAEAYAPFKEISDRVLANGDYSNINFMGYVDGAELEGGKADNFKLKIGSGQFIPGFEEQLIGMAIGEEKEINVTFPNDYNNKNIAGKDAKFIVKLNKIEVKDSVTIDDELAKKLYPSDENITVATLREKVKEQLVAEKKKSLYDNELKPKLIDILIESLNFDLPDFIVEQEMDIHFNNKVRSMSAEEINVIRDSQEKIRELKESFRDDASKSVKMTFIVDELAKIEKIDVSENELLQTIYYEAMSYGQDPQKVFGYYKDNGLLPALKMAIIEDKLLSTLLDKKFGA